MLLAQEWSSKIQNGTSGFQSSLYYILYSYAEPTLRFSYVRCRCPHKKAAKNNFEASKIIH